MSDDRRDDQPQRPSAEPEILPPEHAEPRRPGGEPSVWVTRHRLVFATPGPFALILGLLGLGALAVIGLVLFLGLFLFWLPVLGALALGLLLAALVRGPR
jgi:hypothetical protein